MAGSPARGVGVASLADGAPTARHTRAKADASHAASLRQEPRAGSRPQCDAHSREPSRRRRARPRAAQRLSALGQQRESEGKRDTRDLVVVETRLP